MYRDKSEYLQVKYPEEVRLSLGVSQVKLLDGSIEGRWAKPFVYSAKVLLSIADYEVEIQKEIKRVRGLKGTGPPWCVNSRNGQIWGSDSVMLLKGCETKLYSF